MGKTTNRVLSAMLTVLMILSMVSVFVFPASAETESSLPEAFNLDYSALYNGDNTYLINNEWTVGDLKEGNTLTFVFQGVQKQEKYNAKRHFAKFTDAYKVAYEQAFKEGRITADNYFDYVPCFIFGPGTHEQNLGLHTSAIVLGNNAGISPNAEQEFSVEAVEQNSGWKKNENRTNETSLPSINVTSRTLHANGDYALTPASGEGAQWIALRETAYDNNPDKRQTVIVDGITLTSSISVRGHDQGGDYEYGDMKGKIKSGRYAQVYANNIVGATTGAVFAGTDGSYYKYDVYANNFRVETECKNFYERHYVINSTITNSYFANFTNSDYGFFKAYGYLGEAARVSGGVATVENCIFYNMSGIPFQFNARRSGPEFNIKNNILYNLKAGAFKLVNQNKNAITINITGNYIHQAGDTVTNLFVTEVEDILGGKNNVNFNDNWVTGNITNVAPNSPFDGSVSGSLYYNFNKNFFGETKDSQGKTITFAQAPEGTMGNAGWDYTDTNYYFDYNKKFLSYGLNIKDATGFGEGNVVEIIGDQIIARCFKNRSVIYPVVIPHSFEGTEDAISEIAEDAEFENKVDGIDLSQINGVKDYFVRLVFPGTDYYKTYSLKIIAAQPQEFNSEFKDNGLTVGNKKLDYKNTAVYVENTELNDNGEEVAYGYIGDKFYEFKVDNDVVFATLKDIDKKVTDPNRNILLPSGEYTDFNLSYSANFYGANLGVDAVDEGVADDGSDWRLGAKWGTYGETGIGSIVIEDGVAGNLTFEGVTLRGQVIDTNRKLGKDNVAYGALNLAFKNVVINQIKMATYSDKRTALAIKQKIGDNTGSYLFNLNNMRSANHNNMQVADTGLGFEINQKYDGFGDTYADSFTLESVYVKDIKNTPVLFNEYVPATVVINDLYRDATEAESDTLLGNIKTGAANKNCTFKLTNSNIRNDADGKGTNPLMSIIGTGDYGSRIADGVNFSVEIKNNIFYNAVKQKATDMFVVAPAYVSSIDFSDNFVYQSVEKNFVSASRQYIGDASSDSIQLVGNTRFYGNDLIGFKGKNVALALGMSKNPELDETFLTDDYVDFRVGYKGITSESMGSNNYYYDYDRTVGNGLVGITSITKTDKVLNVEYSDLGRTIDIHFGAEATLADITVNITDGAEIKWYDGDTVIDDLSTVKADSIYGIKTFSCVIEKEHQGLTLSAKYTVTVFVAEVKDFMTQNFEHEYFSNTAVIVTSLAKTAGIGEKIIVNFGGTYYYFVAGVNAFESLENVPADATEILINEYDASKDLVIKKPVKLYAPNYNVNPVVVGQQGAITTQYGADWGYNSDYTENEIVVKSITIDGSFKGVAEIHGFTVKEGYVDSARKTDNGACGNITVNNARFMCSTTRLFNTHNGWNNNAGSSTDSKEKLTFKNTYFDFDSTKSVTLFGDGTVPAHTTFDTVYFNGKNNFANSWIKIRATKDQSFTIKNSYLKNMSKSGVVSLTFTGYYDGNGSLAGKPYPTGAKSAITYDNNIIIGTAGYNDTNILNLYANGYSHINLTNNYIESIGGTMNLFYVNGTIDQQVTVNLDISKNVFNGISNLNYGANGQLPEKANLKITDNFLVTSKVSDIYEDGVVGANQKRLINTKYNTLEFSYYLFPFGVKQDVIYDYEFGSDVKVQGDNLLVTAYNGTGIAEKVNGGYKLDLTLLVDKNDFDNPMTVKYQGGEEIDIYDDVVIETDSDTIELEFTVYSFDKSNSEKYNLILTIKDEAIPSFKVGYEGSFFSRDALLVDSTITEANGTDIVRRWDKVAYTFTVGQTAFKTLAEAYASPNFKDDVFVLSVADPTNENLNISKPSRVFSPAWDTAPMKEMGNFNALTSNGVDWTMNDEFSAKTVTVAVMTYSLRSGVAETYGFTVHNVLNYRWNIDPDINNPVTIKFINGSHAYAARDNATFYYQWGKGKDNNDTLEFKNVYIQRGKKTFANSGQSHPHLPANVILDGLYYDVSASNANGWLKSGAANSRLVFKNSNIRGETSKHFRISATTSTAATKTREIIFDNNILWHGTTSNTVADLFYPESATFTKIAYTNNFINRSLSKQNVFMSYSGNGNNVREFIIENNKILGLSNTEYIVSSSNPDGNISAKDNYIAKDKCTTITPNNVGNGEALAAFYEDKEAISHLGTSNGNTEFSAESKIANYYIDYAMTARPNTVSPLEFASTENIASSDDGVEIKGVTEAIDLSTIVNKVPGHNTVKTIVNGTENDGLISVLPTDTVVIKVYSYDKTVTKEYTVSFVDAFTHNFTNYVFNNDSTCIENGTETAQCSDAGCSAVHTRVKENSTLPHTPRVVGFDDSEATCQHNGHNILACMTEGCTWTDRVEKPDSTVDHKFENYQPSKPATCNEAGYEKSACKWNCGEYDERQNATLYPINNNHTWGEWTYNNNTTCVATGTDSRECGFCHETETRTSQIVVSDGTQHDFGDYVYNNDATCLKDGTKTAFCKNCTWGTHTVVDTEHLKENTAHVFVNYIYNNDATYENDGTKTAKCELHVEGCIAIKTIVAEGTKLVKPAPKPQEKPVVDTTSVFTDVKAGDWFKQYVDFAYTHGIFKGYTETTFSPATNMTRAQFVQVLANLSNIDTTNKAVSTMFTDVKAGEWYAPAIKWASEAGVVNGMGDGTFAPDAEVTREQMCVMLVNYVENYRKQSLKKNISAAVFADDASISGWAKAAVYKCADAGIIKGVGNNMFAPLAKAERSHGATLFTNFYKEYLA